MSKTDEITILHFNDVYHISDVELVARFASVFSDPRHVTGEASVPQNQLRIFSGDAFSPSLEASVLRGEHMPQLLKALNIDVACYGNHDFDFGESRLNELSALSGIEWTLTNTTRKPTFGHHENCLLAEAHEYVIKTVAGYRIGFFGLAGTDWPSNCQHLPSCEILDPVATARRTAKHLRRVEHCDLVIALTHMRLTEDLDVSRATEAGEGRVDLLLGGHDHDVVLRTPKDRDADPKVLREHREITKEASVNFDGDARIIKSGTDWRGLSVVKLTVAKQSEHGAVVMNTKVKQIQDLKRLPNYKAIPLCPEISRIITDVHTKIERIVEKPLLMTDVALEGRSDIVRSQETNLGNMLADAVRAFYQSDIAFVNSGAIRCDKVIDAEPGVALRIRDVVDISPFDNAFVVKRVSGRILLEAFENSVSDAHTDGRFLQVSGLKITANWNRQEGQRVRKIQHQPVEGPLQPIDLDRTYDIAMVDFIASGFDGYTCFRDTPTLVDAEGAMTDTNLMLQIFGAGGDETSDEISKRDDTAKGIDRARNAIVGRFDDKNGLPVISPVLDGRIQFTNRTSYL